MLNYKSPINFFGETYDLSRYIRTAQKVSRQNLSDIL